MAHDPIPQELVDLIVDNLHDDIPALKSSRTHIFRKIEITPPPPLENGPSTCQRLYKLLTSSLHIASLVDELCIVLVGSETSFEYNEEGQYLTEPHATWIMAGRALSLVLPLLDLRRISLVENSPADWNSAGEFSMNWNKMGRTLKSALTEVFSSPKLESVQLRGIAVESPCQLLSLFSEATSLKGLSLSRVYFTQRWDQRKPWPDSDPWRPQLRFLLVSDSSGDSISPYLSNPRIDLSRVQSLGVVADSVEGRDKIVLQTTASGAVEHLRMWYLSAPSSPESIAHIFSANLRSIHLFTIPMFHLLSALFTACPHDSRLETIIIEGPAHMPVNFVSRSLDASAASAIAHLSSLKMVEMKVFVGPGRPAFPEWSGATWSLLPSLVQRGMLTLTEIPVAHGVHHGWE
ncbi:hypothetical protein DFH09DRAFT_1167544 [Mycena vulgaris]|nr:hypothetical protein DFH09DRAFT_1167544 [Mycena vulgaris]